MKEQTPNKIISTKTKLDATFRFNVTILCLCGLFYGSLRLTQLLYDVFAIIGGALLLTYLLLGPVNTVEGTLRQIIHQAKKRIHFQPPSFINFKMFEPIAHHLNIRVFSVLIVYLCFFMVISTTVFRIVPILSSQVKDFATDLPAYLSHFNENLQSISNSPGGRMILENIEPDAATPPIAGTAPSETKIPKTPPAPNIDSNGASNIEPESTPPAEVIEAPPAPAMVTPPPSSDIISKNAIGQIVLYFQKFGPKAVHNLVEVATTTLEGMIYLIATLVIIFYLLLDGQKLKNGFIEFIPAAIRDQTSHFLENTHNILYTFIKGQIILGFLAGFYMWFIFSLYGVKYAGFLGMFFGCTSIVPVIGPWLGLLPGILVVLFSPEPGDLIGVMALAGCFYLIKEYWLGRLILGNVLVIHPVMFILSFLTCVKLAGPVGILLSFPIAGLISVTIQYFQTNNALIIPAGQANSK